MADVGKMVDAVLEAVDKPLRAFAERLKALEARPPEKGEPGLPGENGRDGAPGRDGRDAGDLALLKDYIGEMVAANIAEIFKSAIVTTPDSFRTVQVTLGGTTHELKTGVPLDFGVWTEGSYAAGDAVSHGGSLFIAQTETNAKPGKSEDWRLAVKRGADGRDWRPDEQREAQPVRLR